MNNGRELCINYRADIHCQAVTDDYECQGFKCPFFATEGMRDRANAKTAERLRKLTPWRQAVISRRYYKESGLWWEEEKKDEEI